MTSIGSKSPSWASGKLRWSLPSDAAEWVQPNFDQMALYEDYDDLVGGSSELPVSMWKLADQVKHVRGKARTTDFSGSCSSPVLVQRSEGATLCPCRKCRSCLRWRVRIWTRRALIEGQRSYRTWFLTLTFRPYSRQWLAREAATSSLQMDAAYGLVSSYVKRVRTRSGAKLRFISSVEHHRDGSPHLHLLIFQSTKSPVTWHDLVHSWTHGYVYAKLANINLMIYACKYLTKNLASGRRIRVSRPFGAIANELCEDSTLGLLPDQKCRGNYSVPAE